MDHHLQSKTVQQHHEEMRPLHDRKTDSMKNVLYEVRCLKSNEDMILALTGQFKQLSHEPEKLMIINSKPDELLNKRSELISKCRHENKFYLRNN